ncbi:MAG TPA: M28 family peptidase [Gemmatimonadaceae bacterium]|nr:M28 family peptidase [Gemmatimonadaceae bacterium]
MSNLLIRRVVLAAAAAFVASCRVPAGAPRATLAPDSLAVRRDIDYLAGPALAGRLTGTPGNDSAADYIARRYSALGLRPMAPRYLQRFVARPVVKDGPSPSLPTQNVFALLPGTDPALRGEYVVVGAHFDHLGTSTDGALDPDDKSAVRRGADDNASGTAAVLELARLFAHQPARRSIIFANFSGEEEGLLGSQYFVEHAPVPLDSIDAMLNFDMVGRLKNDRLIVYGVATATEFAAMLDSANAAAHFALAAQGDGFGPSDQSSFYAKNIPVLHFFTDLHEDYHRASDTPDKINGAGEARVIALAARVLRDVADGPARVTFVRVAAPAAQNTGREPTNVYFGSIPDMAGGDVVGLRITGVRPGSPADLAGLKADDVIVEFGGVAVKDLYSYSDALYAHKPGDEVTIVALRNGQRMTFKATLTSR